MIDLRRSGGQIALLVLSLLGAAISIYLTSVHYENVPLVCSTSGFVDCARVLSSSYSVIPGTTIPITIPGLVWSIVSAALAFLALRVWPERRDLRIAQCVLASLGMLSVFYLVYAEIVRLHTLCIWCTAVHVIILGIFIITVIQLQQSESDFELGDVDVVDEPPVTAVREK